MTGHHTFYIPVMGIGFSIDTPVKVAPYGISSVISLVDDELMEKMREYYCGITNKKYTPITNNEPDNRARRITAYLNLLDNIIKKKFEDIRSSCFESGSEITKYFEMLPDDGSLKKLYKQMLEDNNTTSKKKLQDNLRDQMLPGRIDVNIMTKLDRTNYDKNGEELPHEFSDAMAALRGYSKSTLNSAIIFSAGLNRRLYSYVEKFEDFYANASGFIKKKIILKVNDYRSSVIQGQFFAKKGLWVSEYRVESGLNCGGHTFINNGSLMGPVLEEFKAKRQELISSLHKIYTKALTSMKRKIFNKSHDTNFTAQGGISTAKENNFLLSNYKIDKTGWATPFLLVPDAVNVEEETLKKLVASSESDLYNSQSSPMGVPFNNLKNSSSEIERKRRINEGIPGSPCFKGLLVSNTEFTERPICTASRQYQKLKLAQLKKLNLNKDTFKKQFNKIVEKSCICKDLGASLRIKNGLGNDKNNTGEFPAICPGPNLAYFSKIASLPEMAGHIYGRFNLLGSKSYPNMFLKELTICMEYFIKEIKVCKECPTKKQIKMLNEFKENLTGAIKYYHGLFPKMLKETQEYRNKAIEELQIFMRELENLVSKHKNTLAGMV